MNNISFSHIIASHLYSASGFSIEDGLTEIIHNSFDANSKAINIELINKKYLLASDDGDGNEEPYSFYGLGNKLIKKEKNKIGKKNIGFIGMIGSITPESVMIYTLKKDDENVKSLLYKSGEHIKRIQGLDSSIDRDYKKITCDDLFVSSIEGSGRKFFRENEKLISEGTKKIFNNMLDGIHSGTIIIIELNMKTYNILNNIFNVDNDNEDKSDFIDKLIVSTKDVDKVNFFIDNSKIDKGIYNDILSNGFQTIYGKYIFYSNDEYYLIEENICIGDKVIKSNYLKLLQSINRIYNIDKKIYNNLLKETKKLGNVDIGYQLWDKNKWDDLKFGKHDQMRNLIYNCFDGQYRFFAKSLKEASDSSARNYGPFLSFININEKNIDFAEQYLGLTNNKSSSSTDSFNKYICKVLLERFRKKMIDNFSYYTLYTEYTEYHKSKGNNQYLVKNYPESKDNKACSKGIVNWIKYNEIIEKIFDDNNDKKYNYLIVEYEKEHHIEEKTEPKKTNIKKPIEKVIDQKPIIEKKIEQKQIIFPPQPIKIIPKEDESKKNRKDFQKNIVEKVKLEKGDICHITHIPNTNATPTQKDHKDGNSSNNSIDNLNIINIGLHHIKTTNYKEYEKIISSDENVCEYMVEMLHSIVTSDKLTTYLRNKNKIQIKKLIDDLYND